ncbi:hypothetical protein [Asticcacaulis sp.]|uniref:hypothetical protein n=1 Tax=Asticcacaulis sp. TaxID=1872648 RepID=UPI00263853D5|nr:hypothetical protein [Asticcacaulis sp.]
MTYTRLATPLTEQEKKGVSRYCDDSMIFHAIQQGWRELACHHPDYAALAHSLPTDLVGLDSAIEKSYLVQATTLWSAHGCGTGCRGALIGDARSFVGTQFQYPGFVSTSTVKDVAVFLFLRKKAYSNSRPTLLQFELPAGFNVVGSHHCGHHGEMEYIIGRDRLFDVAEASYERFPEVEDEALVLKLLPA